MSRIVAVEVSLSGKSRKEKVSDIRTCWEIPLDGGAGVLSNVSSTKREGKRLDKPKVRPKVKARKKDGTSDGGT